MTRKMYTFVYRSFKLLTEFVDQNKSKLWIIPVGLFVIPYILLAIGSVLFPTNNLFLILTMFATSEGVGTFSYSIRRWWHKTCQEHETSLRKCVNDFNVSPNYGSYHGFSRSNETKTVSSDADLRCEEAIMKDKERFGRARTSLMKHLRIEYGRDVADRALRRINKRGQRSLT